jgi:hypothetical protein
MAAALQDFQYAAHSVLDVAVKISQFVHPFLAALISLSGLLFGIERLCPKLWRVNSL